MAAILNVRNISAGYYWEGGFTRILENLNFDVEKGIILGIAGESGSGKSTLASVLYGSLKYPGKIISGSVMFDGVDILKLKQLELRRIRGARYSFIPQAAMNALNPVKRIKFQFYDLFMAHNLDKSEYDKRMLDAIELVRLNENVLYSYPHELSGGMRQRVVISMALALSPELVLLDEPTTGLDVLVEHDILSDIKRIQRSLGITMIFISHDLSILFQISDEMMMMYGGEIVEYGSYKDLLYETAHPYTYLLKNSIPVIGKNIDRNLLIKGTPMNFSNKNPGCYFLERCIFADDECKLKHPELQGSNHMYRCSRYPMWKDM
ncbi:ABC transporter ATP-binding protein [Picrophilus oshimae]|uniref:Peptide/nickel transport system ATP-binding protein n=1 Tax=Picrophilus torridus (strain ATCC 700027 / DSM 9790 / JCM 10055 / NBRC 100828 / KAW 2/3) TaxID=1122961 RepID=A0A8G2L7E2_PICTO|nr:ABC transporter ATP-binding protein [Picrophilus oshimae]SMD30895.1 peptide/nickel transport system ATP-binding protein [Picrophilus oshimae DSM 9789]